MGYLLILSLAGKGSKMMRYFQTICVIFLSLFIALGSAVAAEPQSPKTALVIHGQVLDSAGMPLADASVIPYLDRRPFIPALKGADAEKQLMTGRNGLFMIEIPAPAEKIKDGKWSVKITRPSFKPSQTIPLTKLHDEGTDEKGMQKFVASVSPVSLERYQGTAFFIALVVFLVMYGFIAFEVMHRTLAAFLGAALILVITHSLGSFDDAYKILTWEQAVHAVDWNVIFLLMGMMIIVGVLKVSGIFQWLAYKSFEVAKGQIFLMCSALCVVTAFVSAFLDNVTTMLLLTPVTMEIAVVLGISPLVLLVPEILASNFGGTATLIGDPPNIMIGSYAGITFNDFVINLTPVVIAVMVAQIIYNKFYYGKEYHRAKVEDVAATTAFLR